MKKLILSLILLSSPLCAAETYQNLMKDFRMVYIQMLEAKIEKIPINVTIEVFLKDGTSVQGIFKGYYPYSDKLWIHPLNSKWGIFSNRAYDIRQIQDVTVIILRSI